VTDARRNSNAVPGKPDGNMENSRCTGCYVAPLAALGVRSDRVRRTTTFEGSPATDRLVLRMATTARPVTIVSA
jgi:hypothetical protein